MLFLLNLGYNYFFGQLTFSEKEAFNVLNHGVEKLRLDESRKFILKLNEKSAIFFFNKLNTEINFSKGISNYNVIKPLTCKDQACICLCTKCKVIEGTVNRISGISFCKLSSEEQFSISDSIYENFKGGVMIENNFLYEKQYSTVNAFKSNENTISLCENLPC